MDNPPVPKPRSSFRLHNENPKHPVPLPRTKMPANDDKVSATGLLRSISTVSRQLTEDVALKVSNSAKSANEILEKKICDGSRFAKGTIEKTITTSRAVRDSVTRSVIDGTKTGLRIRKPKKNEIDNNDDTQRCVSMPVVDVSLFDNIQFHSPLLEQKEFKNTNDTQESQELSSLNHSSPHSDDLSLFSNNSDSTTDTVSNFSFDNRESEHLSSLGLDEQLTYDTPKQSRTNSIISFMSTPEVPERRKKRESSLDVMRQNSLYENWNLPHQSSSAHDTGSRPSKSTILEFDPLNTSTVTPKYQGISNELILLESFLIGDTYGSIVSTDNSIEEPFVDYNESDYFNPPTPPERTDSLCNETNIKPTYASVSDRDSTANWYLSNETDSKALDNNDIKHNTVMQKFSHMLKLDHVLHKPNKQNVQKVDIVERPALNVAPVPYYNGILTRIVSGVVEDLFKNSQTRYCVLSDHTLICYTDPTHSTMKEAYSMDSVSSLQIVLPLSSSASNNSYCFELMMSSGGLRNAPRKILFSCGSASDRRNWSQKISEHLTSNFPTKYTAEFTRCGWCYLKEGVSGEWQGAWVMLVRRVLVYYTTKDPTVRSVDLRKTRCVVTQVADEETKQACPTDGDNLVLDCPHATIYLRFPNERELKGWKFMVKLAAHNNGSHLHHQQLTKEDVPAIVDKCLSFIYAHGSLSEGIYRRAGSNPVLAELLARFRRDAWSVQLSPGQHSEHDVAGVLKRFFRDLPEPLIPKEKYQGLIDALRLEDERARHAEFRATMSSLPLVARNTARKLFAHLHFLHTMAHVNKMTADNLASIWGPNVMPGVLTTSNSLESVWSSKEMFVIREMIANFEAIWQPTEAEGRREAAVRRVLTRVLSSTAPAAHRAAGDLRAWLYVRDKSTCYQIALTPNKTSSDVCIELCEKAKTESHLLMIEEVICNDAMRRTVHVDEIVLDVVLRWGYWDEEDRKDNYLLLKENKILHDMEAIRPTTSLVCGELRYANEHTKTFKSHMFEFQNGKLCYFKDKQGSHKLDEWNIKDILWYTGHEPRRNPQSRWAITFITKNNKQKRSKDRPWFGSTIAGSVSEDQLRWVTAMTFAEHNNILPTPRLVIT